MAWEPRVERRHAPDDADSRRARSEEDPPRARPPPAPRAPVGRDREASGHRLRRPGRDRKRKDRRLARAGSRQRSLVYSTLASRGHDASWTLRKEYHEGGARVAGIQTASQTAETSAKNATALDLFLVTDEAGDPRMGPCRHRWGAAVRSKASRSWAVDLAAAPSIHTLRLKADPL